MRAITTDEIRKIAGGRRKQLPPTMRPMLLKPPGGGGGIPTPSGGTWYPSPGGGHLVGGPSSGGSSTPPSSWPSTSGGGSGPTGGGGGGSDGNGIDNPDNAADLTSDADALNVLTVLYDVNVGFIHSNESPDPSLATVPNKDGNVIGHSGLTIGWGFDVGQISPTVLLDFEKQGVITNSFYKLLEPFAGLQGEQALNEETSLSFPSHLTASETKQAEALSDIVLANTTETIGGEYYQATLETMGYDNPTIMLTLPSDIQTAIADVGYSSGTDLADSAHNFWNDITTYNWTGAEHELRNWEDGAMKNGQPVPDPLQARHDRDAQLIEDANQANGQGGSS